MDFGRENVNTAAFLCQNCRQPLFYLYDITQGQSATMALGMQCCNCGAQENRIITPTPNDMAGSGQPIQPLGNLPENMLLCGNPSVPPNKLAPDGVCRGNRFRVMDRGNELLSRCEACGNGDSLGMIHGAHGQ